MKNNKKGFTLAELLVVVAIIAVLIAIAIPVFTAQLEKSREAVDAANIRSEYAQVMVDAITGDTTGKTYEVVLKQQEGDWQTTEYKDAKTWPENLSIGSYTPAKGDTVTLTYSADTGVVTVTKK